jgi:putative transposase
MKYSLFDVAILDWFSRYVLAWQTSITLDTSFCLDALDQALRLGQPEIFNSDQGVQFTSRDFTARLQATNIRISWDGRGRAFDNIFVERLWRTVKYEEVYLKDYDTVPTAIRNLKQYFTFYNEQRCTKLWTTKHQHRSTQEEERAEIEERPSSFP